MKKRMHELWVESLVALGLAVGTKVCELFVEGIEALSEPVAFEGGDTIFAIDRNVEPILEKTIEAWPVELKPLVLVAEGMGDDGIKSFGNSDAARFRLMIDPIDGTRGLMYDKRSAWFLASVAENHGEQTRLSHSFASVMVELPTSKQTWLDCFSAIRGQGVKALRQRTNGTDSRSIAIRPSRAQTLLGGFAQVSNFFPGTKVQASSLMETIVSTTVADVRVGEASVFEDQYVSTGGQMVELMMGHDRFCCDLRPLFYELTKRAGHAPSVKGVECHPYDIAGLLVAEESGIIVTDGYGNRLDAAFNVSTPIHWCGYANQDLRQLIEPVLVEWLAANGLPSV